MANIQKINRSEIEQLPTFSALVAEGKLPPKPSALGPEDVEGRQMLWDLTTIKVEQFNHKLGGIMVGLRVTAIDPETGERKLFMSAAEGLVAQVTEQLLPFLDRIPSLLPVTIVGQPHKSDPARKVWSLT